MKFQSLRVLWLAIAPVFGACTVYEATKQTHFAREYMTADLEDQIMFNLIRAKNGLPFQEYEVQQLQGVVTSSLTPQGGVGRTTTTNLYPLANSTQTTTGVGGAITKMVTTTTGAATAASQTIMRPYSFNVTANRQSVVTAVINPVTQDPSVYMAYADFLNFDHEQQPPPPKEKFKEIEKDTLTQPALDREGRPIPAPSPKPGEPTPTARK